MSSKTLRISDVGCAVYGGLILGDDLGLRPSRQTPYPMSLDLNGPTNGIARRTNGQTRLVIPHQPKPRQKLGKRSFQRP